MHPDIVSLIAHDRIESLRRDAARHRRAKGAASAPPRPVGAAIQLRLSACRAELERLATLSERRLRDGDWIVAELDGVAVAAVSVADGTTVYDPFKPTSQLVSLLELRRKQVLAAA